MGLAVPSAQVVASGALLKRGLLVKDGSALERLAECDMALFDKTGTLTRGEPTVTAVEPAQGTDADSLLELAAAAESDSEHPLARAIVAAWAS